MRWSLAALILTTVACNSPSTSISAPTDFTVTARAGRIELSWQYDAGAALGFVILRQEATSEAALAMTPSLKGSITAIRFRHFPVVGARALFPVRVLPRDLSRSY
jgi:hypothetical protein